ncbi:MAG: STELLO glycosyltransferase family protein [Flavobacteriales bacterium]|nr:STELLO glycosyltransferase family protein [Flavobacteriales bacterium]
MEHSINKVFVCLTTIQKATEAVRKFAAIPGYRVVVTGDLKTPAPYGLEANQGTFLNVQEQNAAFPELSEALPVNSYTRKNVAYAVAIREGASVIVDTDDDNIPYDDFEIFPFDASYDTTASDLGMVNIYKAFTDQKIWPRGLPLPEITRAENPLDQYAPTAVRVGVWQGLADGDPDVDAIYRLVDGSACIFNRRAPLVLAPGTWTPFNSQNTVFRREVFPLLYIPCTVTFRFSDILRSWVAQPILWQAGYTLGFTRATVFQDRNPHNYMVDFESEIPMYLQAYRSVEVARNAVSPHNSLLGNLWNAYQALGEAGIVQPQEFAALKAWLKLFE